LLSLGLLNSNPVPQDAPFFVDFIATAPRERVFLGVQYTQHFPMTSTQHAQDILQSLADSGVRNIHAQYSYWANGGMHSGALDNIRPLRSIGGASGMRDLQRFSDNNNVEIFPTVNATTFVDTPGRLGRTSRGMLSRAINNSVAFVAWHHVHNRITAGSFTLLSPQHWAAYAGRIVRGFNGLGLRNIAVNDLGNLLFGDYGRSNQITRLDAVPYAEAAMATLSNDLGLMLVNPNVYGFAYANVITDLPFSSGGRRMVDFNIPFVQMVLGQHIPFSMPAYNINSMQWRGFEEYLLRAVESRSGLKLIMTYEPERAFFPTFVTGGPVPNNMFFQTEYSRHWQGRIGEYYARFNAFYQAVRGAEVTAHTVLELGSHVIVEYSNGVVVYINYSDSPWEIGGRVIAPLSFETN
jgi:hypothetical protein